MRQLVAVASAENVHGAAGRVSGSIYHGGREHCAFLGEVMGLRAYERPPTGTCCPSASRFEAEIVGMTADLLGGKTTTRTTRSWASSTSGGTDSILSAVLAYGDAAAARGVDAPELVLPAPRPRSRRRPRTSDSSSARIRALLQVVESHPDDIARAITPRTCAVDGVERATTRGMSMSKRPSIGHITQERGVGPHVDACLGGFILPWLERLGAELLPVESFPR